MKTFTIQIDDDIPVSDVFRSLSIHTDIDIFKSGKIHVKRDDYNILFTVEELNGGTHFFGIVTREATQS